MIRCFSTAIDKKKWAAISGYGNIGDSILRSYIKSPMHKATIILDNYGIQSFDAEWGLIPEWSRDGKIRGTLINARFEQLLSSPSFRIPIRQKRCLIPIDSFYIWHKTNHKKEVPYRVLLRNEEPLFVAGLWDKWYSRYGTRITFAMITHDSGEHKLSLGDRVPMAFTDIEKGIEWLQKRDLRESVDMLHNPRYEDLRIYRIAENFEKHDGSHIHDEVREEITLFD